MPDSPNRPRGIGRAFAEMHYQLRTEGDTPWRQAQAVFFGVLIGAIPLYGIHLLFCAVVARVLGLNRIKTYLAAHINNPLTYAFILYFEFGLGRYLLTGDWPALSRADLAGIDLWTLAKEIALGALVFGLASGVLLGAVAWLLAARWKSVSVEVRLKDEASRRYVPAGVFAWEFVRGKLRGDPVYFDLLREGLLPDSGRLLDLGCGRGILLSLIDTAAQMHAAGNWPDDWPPPPRNLRLTGIDLRQRSIDAARAALADRAEILQADVRGFEPPASAAVVLLDVLHYLAADEQRGLLKGISRALAPGGVVLIREADAGAGVHHRITRGAERVATILRGHPRQRFHYRSLDEWCAMLRELGLDVTTRPMRRGTPFSNVLIVGRKSA